MRTTGIRTIAPLQRGEIFRNTDHSFAVRSRFSGCYWHKTFATREEAWETFMRHAMDPSCYTTSILMRR